MSPNKWIVNEGTFKWPAQAADLSPLDCLHTICSITELVGRRNRNYQRPQSVKQYFVAIWDLTIECNFAANISARNKKIGRGNPIILTRYESVVKYMKWEPVKQSPLIPPFTRIWKSNVAVINLRRHPRQFKRISLWVLQLSVAAGSFRWLFCDTYKLGIEF